jgi:transposase
MSYSMDLRKKIIATYQEEKNQSRLARRFKISLSTVKRYLKLDREGDLSPRVGDKGRPSKIDEEGVELIKATFKKNPTVTLEELSRIFYQKKKLTVGRSVLSRACLKLNLRHKKLSRYAAETQREEVKKNAKTTWRK